MKNKTSVFILVLTGLLILSGYTIFRLNQVNEKNRTALPYLVSGEEIKYFDLVDDQARMLDRSVLTGEKPSLIFIFSRPCSPCNQNIVFWKKMAALLKGKVNVYGIVLADAGEAFGFSEEAKLNFKIYIPDNRDAFIEAMRLKMNLSQTIIYHRGGVFKLKMGDLNSQEATGFIKTARGLS